METDWVGKGNSACIHIDMNTCTVGWASWCQSRSGVGREDGGPDGQAAQV